MSNDVSAQELAQRFGLDPVSESVKRLTRIVSNQDMDLDEIAKLICLDPDLTARLLRAANPNAAKKEEFNITTVEQALMRNGVGGALLLAMSTPLMHAVAKTFQTMLNVMAPVVPLRLAALIEGEHVLGEVAFSGKATGVVCLHLTDTSARWIAARMLGLTPQEMNNPTEVEDVIGEVSNIVVGNFKSNLCDAGLDCKLSPPKITRTADFKLRVVPRGLAERMVFRNRDVTLFLDISVDPWTS